MEKIPKRQEAEMQVIMTAQKKSEKDEMPTTDPKQTKFELPKGQDAIGTGVALFTTFNQE